MIPHVPFDQELLDFKQAIQQHQIVYSNSTQQQKIEEAIFNAIFENLLNQKTTIVVSKSDEVLEVLRNLLDRYDLGKFCLNIDDLNIVDDRERAQFQKANIPNKSLEKQDLDKLAEYANSETEKITSIYNQFNTPCFGSKSVKDLIYAYRKVKSITEHQAEHLDLDDAYFTFNKEEFWNLRNGLNQSISKFSPIFNVIEQSNIVGNNINYTAVSNDDKSKTTALDHEIEKVRIVIKSLRTHLDNYILDYRNHFRTQKELTLGGLKEIRENLIFIKYHSQKKQSGFLGFGKKKPTDISPLQTKLDKILDGFNQDIQSKNILGASLQASLNAEEISKAITQLEKTEIAFEHIDLISQKINLNHLEESVKIKLTKLIDSTTASINGSEFLSKKIESGGFTFKHQLQTFESLLQQLINLKNIDVQLKPFIEWQKLRQNQSRELNHLINGLKRYPAKHWMLLFETWYIKKLVLKNKPQSESLNYQFEYISKFQKRILEEKLAYIQNLNAKNREAAKQGLKRNNKKLFNLISSKKAANFNWVDLLSAGSFVLDFFPIIFTTEVKHLQANKNANSYFVLDSFETIAPDDLLNASASLVIFDQKRSSAINQYLKEKEYCSAQLNTPIQLPLQSVQITQANRFQIIRNLAKNIFKLNADYQYFQTKRLSIISFCGAAKVDSLTKHFEPYQIKAMPVSHTESGIVENLLDPHKKIIIIFEDALINNLSPELYLWQFHLIQCLQYIGAHCYSINSDNYFQEGSQYLSQVWSEIESLSGAVKPEKDHLKNVLTS